LPFTLDYLKGRRTHLEWPLDLRLARSDFHREVLGATAAVPYGTVTSYVGIATEIGQPRAVRAVAQALRHNPVPIVVPCHRIIGASGDLTGYAGNKLGLKEQLLAVEGVRTEGSRTRVTAVSQRSSAVTASGRLTSRFRRASITANGEVSTARRPVAPSSRSSAERPPL
jgi:O-6-methylguanine DNA methyltransferase